MYELLYSLVDEDEADEGGEGFLREACDVADQRAGVRGDQEKTQEGRPQADTGAQRQVRQVIISTERRTFKDNSKKKKKNTRHQYRNSAVSFEIFYNNITV